MECRCGGDARLSVLLRDSGDGRLSSEGRFVVATLITVKLDSQVWSCCARRADRESDGRRMPGCARGPVYDDGRSARKKQGRSLRDLL